jgi:PAS domain-containing protein
MSNNIHTIHTFVSNQAAANPDPKKRIHHRAMSYEEDKEAEPKSKYSRLDANDNEQVEEPHDVAALEQLLNVNIALRRQVQILESIPDEVFVFDLNGRIRFSNSEESTVTSFWELTTRNSEILIQTAINNALIGDADEDGSWPLFKGRATILQFIYKDQHNHQEHRLVSIKGNIYLNNDTPECVVMVRQMGNEYIGENIVSDGSVSV